MGISALSAPVEPSYRPKGLFVHILRFTLDETRYAVAIDRVVEVVPRVLVTSLHGAPAFVEGVFSFRQAACVAVSMRQRLGHPRRAPALDEHILVMRGRRRLLGLVVDRADGDEVVADQLIEPNGEGAARGAAVSGIVALADGVLLIHDVDALLTDDEERVVDASLEGASP